MAPVAVVGSTATKIIRATHQELWGRVVFDEATARLASENAIKNFNVGVKVAILYSASVIALATGFGIVVSLIARLTTALSHRRNTNKAGVSIDTVQSRSAYLITRESLNLLASSGINLNMAADGAHHTHARFDHHDVEYSEMDAGRLSDRWWDQEVELSKSTSKLYVPDLTIVDLAHVLDAQSAPEISGTT
jgi:hypothetical protein